MADDKANVPDMHIVVGCLQDQQATVRQTVPTLMSAALYADKLTIVTFEDDTLPELREWSEISTQFGDFLDCKGADSQFSGPEDDDWDEEDDPSLTDTVIDKLWVKLALDRLKTESDPAERERLQKRVAELETSIAAEEERRTVKMRRSGIDGVLQIVEGLMGQPNTFPIIYDPLGVLVADSYELQRLSRPSKRRAEANARFGSGAVGKLPSFEQLEAAEIVEVRRQLRDWLAPFRSYVSETSTALIDAGRDEEALADVIHELYIGKVRPLMAELNDEVTRSGYLRTLLSDFGRDPKSFVTSFVTFGLGDLAHIPTYAAAAVAASAELLRVRNEAVSAQRKTRSNRLYYLHELEHEIGKRT